MIKNLSLLLLIFTVVLLGTACKRTDISFGNQFIDNGYTQIIKVDTFTADIATVYIDSFISSAKGFGTVGSYKDPYFGKITSESYCEVAPPAYSDIYLNTTYDSISLILKLDHSFYGDTTKPITINVHQLAQSIVGTDATTSNIYNLDSFQVMPTALGSKTFTISPNRMDTLAIKLDDSLGQRLLRKLQNKLDQDITNNTNFVQYFKGLRISASSGGCVYNFKDSVTMRLYYTKHDLFTTSQQTDFSLYNKPHQFNHISYDRTGTSLQNLTATNREINASLTGNMAFSQPISGCMTKISFNAVKNIFKLPNYVKLMQAKLIVRPMKNSYSAGMYPLPPQLRLSTTNQFDLLGSDLTAVINGSAQVQYGNLYVDYLYGTNTTYTYDLTSYLKAFISSTAVNERDGLLLAPPSPAYETNFNRIVLGNKLNINGNIELQIFYAAVQ